jgi:hypothetical protein
MHDAQPEESTLQSRTSCQSCLDAVHHLSDFETLGACIVNGYVWVSRVPVQR